MLINTSGSKLLAWFELRPRHAFVGKFIKKAPKLVSANSIYNNYKNPGPPLICNIEATEASYYNKFLSVVLYIIVSTIILEQKC